MPAGQFDFTIEQGATFSQQVTWRDSTGSAIDLTGYSARMDVRKSHVSTTRLIQLSTTNGFITISGSIGRVDILLPASGTETLTPADAVYDLEMVAADGTVTRLLEGKANITAEVTK